MEKEKIEYLRERIRNFFGHPFIRKFFEEYHGLDPDKLREDLEYILNNAPDTRIYIAAGLQRKRRGYNLKEASIEDVVYYLKLPRSSIPNRDFYSYYSQIAAKSIAGLIALALAAHMHRKYGKIPRIIPPHAYTLRKAHEGDYSLLNETYWIVKNIKAEDLNHNEERMIARILFRARQHNERSVRRELEILRKIAENKVRKAK